MNYGMKSAFVIAFTAALVAPGKGIFRGSSALVALRDAVENINSLLGSDAAQAIPASIQSALVDINGILDSLSPDSPAADQLNQSLAELTQVLRNLESVTRTLADQPSTLIFSPPVPEDPVPQKRSSP